MQYKFRGKRKDNGEWVCGSLLIRGNKSFIIVLIESRIPDYSVENSAGAHGYTWAIEEVRYEVGTETVGMCSGIWDKNMNDIYEGDIIKVAGRLLKVVFDAGCFLSLWGTNRYRLNQWGSEGVEILSNIHDHPHLLNPAARTA